MPKKLKPVRAVHANRGIEAKYRKRLTALAEEMANSIEYWVKAGYKKHQPTLASKLAQDATPAAEMMRRFREMAARWILRFEEEAPRIAEAYARAAFGATDNAFRAALRDAGWTVEFRMTPVMRDAFQATLAENVGLIKSIPEQYLRQVEGIVTRSYTAGRDLGTLSKELRERFGATKKRAALIARDQSNKANAVVNRARQLELGITEAVWLHSTAGKEPRPDHVAANGKKYKIAEGCLISGEYIQPGELINCRCVSRPVLPI